MRPMILAVFAAALLMLAPAARAAPTCQDESGQTIRCGTVGAMPVGWTLPPGQRPAIPASGPAEPSPAELAALACIIGGLTVLIALMPPFDGSRSGGGWDKQEGDDDA